MSKRIATVVGAALGVLAVIVVFTLLVLFVPLGKPVATPRATVVVLTTPGPSLTPMPSPTPTLPVGDQPGSPQPTPSAS